MKIIGIAALAFAISAFAARAQTGTTPGPNDSTTTQPKSQTTEDKGTAVLPGDQNSSALPGNSSNTATSNSTLPSNDPKANTTPSADTSAKKGQTLPDDGSKDDVKPPKSNKKVKKRGTAQGRSQGSMHRKSTDSPDTKGSGSSSTTGSTGSTGSGSATDTRTTPPSSDTSGAGGSVARPPAPSPTDDAKAPAKDPGMSSRPGDVSGQPTDTQKPVDTAPSSNPPKDK